jgi:RNA polymerase sigma-70 factor, ECF subfamily
MSKALVDRILYGDEQAVEILYRKYSKQILRYIQKKVPSEIAEEVLNDVFFDFIDNLIFIHNYKSIQSYLFGIAHHKIANYYRKKQIKTILLSQLPFLELIDNEVHQPDFQYEKNIIRDKIESTLHSLSKDYRTILRLHYEEDISVKEIALILNISFKATESLLYRARQSFIKTYERA